MALVAPRRGGGIAPSCSIAVPTAGFRASARRARGRAQRHRLGDGTEPCSQAAPARAGGVLDRLLSGPRALEVAPGRSCRPPSALHHPAPFRQCLRPTRGAWRGREGPCPPDPSISYTKWCTWYMDPSSWRGWATTSPSSLSTASTSGSGGGAAGVPSRASSGCD